MLRERPIQLSPDRLAPAKAEPNRTLRRSILRVAPLPDTPLDRVSVDLPPPPGVQRWVQKRKAAVVAAILAGEMTIEDACERYDLSAEEILSWRNRIAHAGVDALRATHRGAVPSGEG